MTNEKGLPRIYADANMFIELGAFAKRLHNPMRENDIWFFRQVLKAHEDGHIEVCTSSISIAECTHVKDKTDPDHAKAICDPDVQEFFRSLITSGSLVTLVQDSIFVAEKARDLYWKHDLKLKGMDAIHVASALDAECREFLTWDSDMDNEYTKRKIEALKELKLHIMRPSESELLPAQYRQAVLSYDKRKAKSITQ